MKSEEQEEDVAIEDAETKTSPQLRGAHLIDSFIQETKGKQRVQMKSLEEEEVGSYFESPEISNEEEEIYTENMVNIYIKQGRYEQAYEILSKICLNNPKKSSIFATQMNLLEVIISGKQQ
jgi:tetratricopeptide (TPR) repeat protein